MLQYVFGYVMKNRFAIGSVASLLMAAIIAVVQTFPDQSMALVEKARPFVDEYCRFPQELRLEFRHKVADALGGNSVEIHCVGDQ